VEEQGIIAEKLVEQVKKISIEILKEDVILGLLNES